MGECKPVDLKSVQDRYKKGDRVAGFILGRYYQCGEYVKIDEKRASSILVDLAEKGHWGSRGWCHEYGYSPYEKSTEKAVECYRKGVEERDEVSLCNLGFCYNNGKGVDKNVKEAASLYSRAANKGYAVAMFNLAFCYRKGEGVKKDKKKAVQLYSQAADKGYARAICNLGWCYECGKGVKADEETAIELYKKAADLGNVVAMDNLKNRGIDYTPCPKQEQQEQEEEEMKEKAEQKRIAAEKAEQERMAVEKAEQERIATEKAEQERSTQHEGEAGVPASTNMGDWTVNQVTAFISNMGLGQSAAEIATKFDQSFVSGEELLSYSSEKDMMEEVDIPKKAARLILKQRDAYLAKVGGGGHATSPTYGASTPSSSRLSTSSCARMTEDSVFISLRFGEAMEEAKQLKAALQREGHDAYICEVAPGDDIEEVVIKRLDAAKMVIIMGTETYGSEGTVKFSTKEELRFIMEEEKPFFLVKMCDRFKDAGTRFKLTASKSYIMWKKGTPLPSNLISELEKKYITCI